MTLQLRAIGIYSNYGELRQVAFELGKLNIVTGGSKTGKSALLDIVDYCWGRDECTIPRGDIRRSVSWFAILLDRDGEGILIARKTPEGSAKVSDEIYLERGVAALPDNSSGFAKNTAAAGLKLYLSNLLGISENLYRPEPRSTRPPLEASSRHAILFCLQFQYEIANPRLLFHRQSDEHVPAAIKDSLAYFMGAMGEDHFLKLRRYEDARARLRKLQRDLAEAKALTDEAAGTGQSLLTEARRHGLIAADAAPENVADMRALLAQVAASNATPDSGLDDPTADLSDLEERRRLVRGQLQDVREEVSDLQRLQREASAFQSEAGEQRARLAAIGLVNGEADKPDLCPLCESRLATAVPSVEELEQSLRSLEDQLRLVERDSPRLQGRLQDLEVQRARLEEELRGIQRDISLRISENERLRIEQAQFTEQARVRGRIGYYLEKVQVVATDEGLRLAVARTNAEVQELAKAIDQEALEERVMTALGVVAKELTRYAGVLGLEHGENPLRLDRKNLTVVADTIEGPLPLTQIGSGENWVGYHLAAHMALHMLFRARARPVPAFLMLDQPSQAHYPPDSDVGAVSAAEGEDHRAVARLYKTIFDFVEEQHGKMQVIVVDHVELLLPWFRASMREKWRDGIKFVPDDWIQRGGDN